ncbi:MULTISPECIES: hypothetical protein [Planktothricoides]|uniref:Uncharacterized protein n=1 Tax=Planktothricoides raciborskii FACHB-1370 TaxID=2949576 RepID=A0ABR8ENI0_9CYAN|nr:MULTISPECIES: hypothetical protein [Planktothricoides]MBD2547634.1 hypothetical protein [Planktothricoides raciborskii FACHB-1370]MBD2586073.1 hypothetical protein [Planktothricoides raciborskii FACHB-1261]
MSSMFFWAIRAAIRSRGIAAQKTLRAGRKKFQRIWRHRFCLQPIA